jgi:hypothetical protein
MATARRTYMITSRLNLALTRLNVRRTEAGESIGSSPRVQPYQTCGSASRLDRAELRSPSQLEGFVLPPIRWAAPTQRDAIGHVGAGQIELDEQAERLAAVVHDDLGVKALGFGPRRSRSAAAGGQTDQPARGRAAPDSLGPIRRPGLLKGDRTASRTGRSVSAPASPYREAPVLTCAQQMDSAFLVMQYVR